MKRRTVFLVLWMSSAALGPALPAHTVGNAEAALRALRAESNAAIAAHDEARLRVLFADDYTGIQGTSSALDSGGEATAASYAGNEFEDRSFVTYRRTPTSIRVAESAKRAAEAGRWEGLWRKADGLMRKSGVYLARWVPSGATWQLQSELFVTLACTGSAACADQS